MSNATLLIIKHSAKVWEHVASDLPKSFFLSKFYISADGDFVRVVEQGEAKRNAYSFDRVTIQVIGGSTYSGFASMDALFEQLEALGYPAFYKDGDVTGASIISALGYTPENVSNKVNNLDTPSSTTYPTTEAVVNDVAQAILSPNSGNQLQVVGDKFFVAESGGGDLKKIVGLVNPQITVLQALQGGSVNTIMHTYLFSANALINSFIMVDYLAVRLLGTTNPPLNFRLYVTNNNNLTGGVIINPTNTGSLNAGNTNVQSRFSFYTETNIIYNSNSENAGATNYNPTSIDLTEPVYFHFFINNGGAISADSIRYFRHINVRQIKTI